MTEPEVASSDANNVAIHIELDENSDELVVTGRTRWSPRDHLLGEWNGGFAVGRAQLGPGRFHPLYAQARMLIWLTARTRSTRWPWPVASSGARPAN